MQMEQPKIQMHPKQKEILERQVPYFKVEVSAGVSRLYFGYDYAGQWNNKENRSMKLTELLQLSTPLSLNNPDYRFLWKEHKPPKVSPSKIQCIFGGDITGVITVILIYNNQTFTGIARRLPSDIISTKRAREIAFCRAVKKLSTQIKFKRLVRDAPDNEVIAITRDVS